MGFGKEELYDVVTEVFDRAVFEGEVEFPDRHPELNGISIIPIASATERLLGMKLKLRADGYLTLYSSGYTRESMISEFTRFLLMHSKT